MGDAAYRFIIRLIRDFIYLVLDFIRGSGAWCFFRFLIVFWVYVLDRVPMKIQFFFRCLLARFCISRIYAILSYYCLSVRELISNCSVHHSGFVLDYWNCSSPSKYHLNLRWQTHLHLLQGFPSLLALRIAKSLALTPLEVHSLLLKIHRVFPGLHHQYCNRIT